MDRRAERQPSVTAGVAVSQVQSVMQAALVTSLVLTLATPGPVLAVHSLR